MNTIRASPDCSDHLIGRSRYGREFLLDGSLPRGSADHVLDVFSNRLVHERHETPSKGHLGSLPILAGVCLP
jgi:hypothetical protein